MKGDFTRSTFGPKKHYSGVRMQQGRVQLDADWNEHIDISSHRINTGTRDTIGLSGAPQDGGGFGIDHTSDNKNLTISQGRIYVDGILCENSGDINITDQEDLPDFQLPRNRGAYLAYLDVWQRHMTAIEDPQIREVALGGPDTATRTKTVWQVKLIQLQDAAVDGGTIHCKPIIDEWNNIIAGSKAELTAFTKQETPSKNPCIVSPGAGYRRLENQLYRVEIHTGGDLSHATFKWSRDNGSVVFAIEGIIKDASNNPTKLKVKQLGKDKTLSLQAGDWVEVLDDATELSENPAGLLVKITEPPDVAGRIITLGQNISGIDMKRHPKVRRWDQGSDAISVTPPSGSDSIELEDGVFVRFSGASFKAGDYWLIPARTATGDIEWPRDESKTPPELPEPPRGIRHHYCRLAVLQQDVTNKWSVAGDCRKLFPAVTELTSFFHVCGDGQEAMPGEELPEPLQVGVSNGELKVNGARVRFEITEGSGTLSAKSPVSNPPLVVETDPDGVAECTWTLGVMDPNNPNVPPHQQVKATLLDACGNPINIPLCFNANLSVAGEVAYKPPGCTEKNTSNGIPTVEELLEANIPGWPPKDTAGNTTVKDVLDTFLCDFDATDIPIQKDSALCNRLKNDVNVKTVQDALNVLCRGIGGCAVTVGKGGKYELLDEAIEALLKEEQADICICLLPGDHELPNGLRIDTDNISSIKIVGCGSGTRIILQDQLFLGSLKSFTVRDVKFAIQVKEAVKNPGVVFDRCEMVTLEACHFEAGYGVYGEPLLTIGGASRIYLKNNLIKTFGRSVAVAIMDGRADAVFEDNIIGGLVSIYGASELNEVLTMDDLIRLAELLQKDALALSQSGGILQLRNNHLMGLVAGKNLILSIKQPCTESERTLYFRRAVLANNTIEMGYNQIIAQHLSLASNSFGNGADAGVVCGYSAVFMGNRASNPKTRLFNVTLSNRKAANLIKIVDIINLPRIWDENRVPPVPYLWNAYNFEGFYYDLTDNLGKEELQVFQPDLSAEQRTIDINNLVYSTGADIKELNVVKYAFGNNVFAAAKAGLDQTLAGEAFAGGTYTIVGFMGEMYAAVRGKINKLAKLIIEQGASASEKKSLTVGETWDIGGGWTLSARSIDAKATPRQVWLVLSKDGAKKDDRVINQGQIYTYTEKSLAGETDVPLFVTYVDSVFAGATSDMVQLKYTWAVDTSVTEIVTGDAYGRFKVVSLDTSCKRLVLKNTDTIICLSSGAIVDLIGTFKFIVADRDDVLRFMPAEETVLNPVLKYWTNRLGRSSRGAVWNETPLLGTVGGYCNTAKWDVNNAAIFYYDITDELGKEKLEILQTDLGAKQRTIDKGNLVYSTEAQPKMLNVVQEAFGGNVSAAAAAGLQQTGTGQAFADGNYYVIGMVGYMGVALNGNVDNLAHLILEHGAEEKQTLQVGETWDIGGGWTLSAQSIDAKATPRQAWLVLSKDGVKKDDKVIQQGQVYTYIERSIAGESNVPLFVTYVDNVFAGATSDAVQLKYTWAVDTSITGIKEGDIYGVFKVVTVDKTGMSLVFRNTDSTISLSQDSAVVLIANLEFKVADKEDVLRFMPVIRVLWEYTPVDFNKKFSFKDLIKPPA
jgi:S-layer protein (TIGR01567 family)